MKTKLTESQIEKVDSLVESLSVQTLPKEEIRELLESEGKAIEGNVLTPAIKMLQLQEKSNLEESSTVAANVAPYVKKIQPLLRRVIPNLIAFNITGVQPVDGPSSQIFAIKSKYAGSKITPIALTAKIFTLSTVTGPFTKGETVTGGTSGATGVVKYLEGSSTKMVVDTITGTFATAETITGGTSTETANIDAIYSSETAYRQILKDYSGPVTTAAGEVLGDDTNQVAIQIESIPVVVKTRKLKAEFTAELVQDLRAMHGANAETEIMNFLETEIIHDIDQEILAEYKTIATVLPDFLVATASNSQGRWNMEMYAGLQQKILKSVNGLATRNRRGKGNKLVCTSSVLTALQSLNAFNTTDYKQNVVAGQNGTETFVGTLKNGVEVYQDWFATEEYAMIIYKGTSEMDAGLVYSPYQPIKFVDTVSPVTLQPVIGISSRYGLTRNTLLDDENASAFAEYFTVDFTNTPLA